MIGTHQLNRWKRWLSACRCSMLGLKYAFLHERAFQEETAILVLVAIPGALLLGRSAAEQALMVGSWMLVLLTELINSSVEAVVDRIGPERHELSGRAKDLGSAAVFIAMASSLLVWTLILWDLWMSRY